MPFRRLLALMSVALLPLTALNAAQAPAASHGPPARAESVSILLDWQRIAIDTLSACSRS